MRQRMFVSDLGRLSCCTTGYQPGQPARRLSHTCNDAGKYMLTYIAVLQAPLQGLLVTCSTHFTVSLICIMCQYVYLAETFLSAKMLLLNLAASRK